MAEKKGKQKLNDLRAQLDRLGYGPGGSQPAKVFSADDIRRTLRGSRSGTGQRSRRGDSGAAGRRGRKATPSPTPAHADEPLVYRRGIPRQTGQRPATRSRPSPEGVPSAPVVLEDTVEGTVLATPAGGHVYEVVTPVAEVADVAGVGGRFLDQVTEPGSPLRLGVGDWHDDPPEFPEQVAFMDVESAGLGNAPIFLVGAMLWDGDDFVVRQFLARDYAEERAMVQMFVDVCDGRKTLITFNGKSFDVPYLRCRAAATGVSFAVPPYHLDLLHVSRRFWRHKLPNCKLQTLEHLVCGRKRHGDIPGDQIPDAYHAYVRSGDARQIVTILNHNLLDLITLADLMTRFPNEDC